MLRRFGSDRKREIAASHIDLTNRKPSGTRCRDEEAMMDLLQFCSDVTG